MKAQAQLLMVVELQELAGAEWERTKDGAGEGNKGAALECSQVPVGPAQHVCDSLVAMLDRTSDIPEREPVARLGGRPRGGGGAQLVQTLDSCKHG